MRSLRHDAAVREPFFNVPLVVVASIAVLAGLHAIRVWGDDLPVLRGLGLGPEDIIYQLAFIPARFALLLGADPVPALAHRLSADPGNVDLIQRLGIAREIVADGSSKPWTLVTYALLHGSWAHLILNSVWLLAFGTAVARRFGTARFVLFLVVTAIGGALGHLATHTADVAPMVGASASISGCMAAAMRFVFQPGAPLGAFRLPEEMSYRLPALPLSRVLSDSRAVTFLVVWFVLNLATGLGADGLGFTDAAIAWEAHVGGFLVGLLAFRFFDPPYRDSFADDL
ncbi:rhomboid family intramembrane serine protease [Alsobacter soli]|uniref:Rhomboid family intramembrane serine protease n=1 Tax=Alsobacter soli TaxID=2109933 RepID=A0A2T1HRX6_9HYPH|nr:rhomboid family intramembrane serine protease [Alsobacter soli]PSC04393.1 rhomboid family intramembrane serine protease [Alsobacter soli]